ncbi:MAG: hypothetical protein ABI874_12250 [Chloroflexota bacterium]
MSELLLGNGIKLFYEYDVAQDMLYILFKPSVGATYYEDVPQRAGVMLRRDGVTDRVVGITVHNVQYKLMQRLVTDLGEQVLLAAA